MTETLSVLSQRFHQEDAWTLDGYERTGGYNAAEKALDMDPGKIVELVKESGLRGRGGAGFPTGVKWSFMPDEPTRPSYVVCNADESEPGTYKDRWLLERDPHQLVEGLIIMGLALRSEHGFIYIRGEYEWPARRLANAIREAYEVGYLGDDIFFGSGRRFDLTLHRGAGAYECGEETALLDSLEGRRGQPRLRPPFPAQSGLYGCPTTVNNVETICNVPHIVEHGAEWYRQWGSEQSPGPKLVCPSGELNDPKVIEVPLGTSVRECIDLCGGTVDDRPVKFFVPGGSSVPMLTGDSIDTGMDFDSMKEAGSLLGTAALMVFTDRTCSVDAALNWTQFYRAESCGKCTPCREGTYWLAQILKRIETGRGRMADIDIVEDICNQIFGRSFCAFGDGAAQPPLTAIKHFRDEWVAHVEQRGCPLGATEPIADMDRPALDVHVTGPRGTIEPPGKTLPSFPARHEDARPEGEPELGQAQATGSAGGQA